MFFHQLLVSIKATWQKLANYSLFCLWWSLSMDIEVTCLILTLKETIELPLAQAKLWTVVFIFCSKNLKRHSKRLVIKLWLLIFLPLGVVRARLLVLSWRYVFYSSCCAGVFAGISLFNAEWTSLHICNRVGQKWTCFWELMTATFMGKKACDMSNVSNFCLEKRTKLRYQWN